MIPSSMDLRQRVAAAVDEGDGSQRQIARRFRVSLWFVSRLLKRRREAGTLAPAPHGGGPRRVLGAADRWRLARSVKDHNDSTSDELRKEGGFECSLTTIWRALRRPGLTRKKKSTHADARRRPDVERKRRSFRAGVKRVEAGRLRFVDESGATTAMARAYAWAPRGERAVGSAPGKWESYTVVAAMGLDGVRAPLALPGSIDAAAFDSYVEDVLAPELRPGDVVVWDRLPSHRGRDAAAAVRRAGARLMYLSP
jgi:transposase